MKRFRDVFQINVYGFITVILADILSESQEPTQSPSGRICPPIAIVDTFSNTLFSIFLNTFRFQVFGYFIDLL